MSQNLKLNNIIINIKQIYIKKKNSLKLKNQKGWYKF